MHAQTTNNNLVAISVEINMKIKIRGRATPEVSGATPETKEKVSWIFNLGYKDFYELIFRMVYCHKKHVYFERKHSQGNTGLKLK